MLESSFNKKIIINFCNTLKLSLVQSFGEIVWKYSFAPSGEGQAVGPTFFLQNKTNFIKFIWGGGGGGLVPDSLAQHGHLVISQINLSLLLLAACLDTSLDQFAQPNINCAVEKYLINSGGTVLVEWIQSQGMDPEAQR